MHFWPRARESLAKEQADRAKGTHIHNVVKHNKSRSFGLLLVSYPYLTYAAITSKQVVQVFTIDLVVQILNEEDTVGTRWQFRLLKGVKGGTLLPNVETCRWSRKRHCGAFKGSKTHLLGHAWQCQVHQTVRQTLPKSANSSKSKQRVRLSRVMNNKDDGSKTRDSRR